MTIQYQPQDEGSEFFDEEYRPCLNIPQQVEHYNATCKNTLSERSVEDLVTGVDHLTTYAEEVRRYYDGR